MTDDTTIEIPIHPDDETVDFIRETALAMGHRLTFEEAFALYSLTVERTIQEQDQ